MNRKWTRAICTVLTSALVFTGPAVEGTTFSGYINSGLEKVYAKTKKQKDAEKKKSQAEQDLKDKKNEINGLKDQQQITADDKRINPQSWMRSLQHKRSFRQISQANRQR